MDEIIREKIYGRFNYVEKKRFESRIINERFSYRLIIVVYGGTIDELPLDRRRNGIRNEFGRLHEKRRRKGVDIRQPLFGRNVINYEIHQG